ncbi:DUF6623 family protein [Mycobacterium sp. BMJ-28]
MAQKLYASWVHGNAAFAEDPAVTVLRQGFGATFNIPVPDELGVVEFHWIHIPIPTPVIMGDSGRLKLVKVLYQVNVADDLTLTGIHVFDGKTLVRHEDSMDVSGDHTDRPLEFTGWNRDLTHVMGFGLGVTLKVRTPVRSTVAGQNAPRHFFIAGAGADFVTQ